MLYLPLEKALRQQVSSKSEVGVKKLVSVLVTSIPVTGTREETVETAEAMKTVKAVETAGTGKDGGKSKCKYQENLSWVLCIRYPTNFGKKSVSALFDSGNKVNAIHPAFAKELASSSDQQTLGRKKLTAPRWIPMEW